MFGAKKKDGKESDFQKLRERQLVEFEKAVPIARAVDAAKSAYNVNVATQYGQLVFRVMLDATFPERAPRIRVLAKVTHAWVDDEMYVRHEKLSNWGPYNNLGKIVSEIYNEFLARPPAPQVNFAAAAAAVSPQQPQPPTPAPAPGGPGMAMGMGMGRGMPSPSGALGPGMVFVPNAGAQPAPSPLVMTPTPPIGGHPFASPMGSGAGSNFGSDNSPVQPPKSNNSSVGSGAASASGSNRGGGGANKPGGGGANERFNTPVPQIPSSFPELDAFSSAQLEDLLSDDCALLHEMVANRDSVVSMRETRSELLDGVEAAAKKTLESKAEVSSLTAQIKALKQQLEVKTAALAALQERQAKVLQKYSLKGVLSVLSDEIDALDERAAALERRYKDGDDADGDERGLRRGSAMDDDGLGGDMDREDKKSMIAIISTPATPMSGSGSVSSTPHSFASAAFSASGSGKLDHSEFCRQYIRLRKRFHARSALRERLQELYGKS